MNEHGQENHQEIRQSVPTQSELYESLRRIGELEDKKQSVQAEIDQRTDELRQALTHIDKDSLLSKMLTAALGTKRGLASDRAGATPEKKRSARRVSRKRTSAAKK